MFYLIFLCLLPACKDEQPKVDLQFNYYPEKNVYYDSLKKDFWYTLDGAKTWNKFTDPAISDPSNLGRKVIIHATDSQVYKENENHRKLHAGKLFAIRNGDTATSIVSNGPEVVERVGIQKKRVVTNRRAAATKPKNGIGKFINKIFGKQ